MCVELNYFGIYQKIVQSFSFVPLSFAKYLFYLGLGAGLALTQLRIIDRSILFDTLFPPARLAGTLRVGL